MPLSFEISFNYTPYRWKSFIFTLTFKLIQICLWTILWFKTSYGNWGGCLVVIVNVVVVDMNFKKWMENVISIESANHVIDNRRVIIDVGVV